MNDILFLYFLYYNLCSHNFQKNKQLFFFNAFSMRVQIPKIGFKTENCVWELFKRAQQQFLESENSVAQSQTSSSQYFILNANTHAYALSMRFQIWKLKSNTLKLCLIILLASITVTAFFHNWTMSLICNRIRNPSSQNFIAHSQKLKPCFLKTHHWQNFF